MKRIINYMFVVICTLFVILTGCKTTKKPPFEKKRSVSITLPYAPESRYLFAQNDTVYFCSYNYNTYKQVDIYDTFYGERINQISLNHLFLPYGVSFIKVKNTDSILVLANDANILYLINKQGKILQKIDIDSLIKKHICFTYPVRVWALSSDKILYKNDIILHVAKDKPIKESNSVYQSQVQHNQNHISLPGFVYISNFLNVSSSVVCDSLPVMSKYMKQNEYFPMIINYFMHRDTLYFYTGFHDKVVRYNAKSLEYIDELKIHSEYTRLKYPVPIITEESIHKVFQNTGHLISRLGFIVQIGFYPKKQHFYVYVSHSHREYQEQKEYTLPVNIDERKSSIIVYDKNWKKISEYMLPDTEKDVYFLEDGNFVTYTKSKNPRNITLNFYQWTE